jgi:predicted O-methyltransferase YrrM
MIMVGQVVRTHPVFPSLSRRAYDVAVVIPTVLRPTLVRAIRSVYAQRFPGRVQILVGVDTQQGDRGLLASLGAQAPSNFAFTVLDPGYSTAVRHGGFIQAGTGGALRTILSYMAHSRLIAYLDDDNWWAPEHLSTLTQAVAGHDWAYSLRWYADSQTDRPLCVDQWESLGPDAGCFCEMFGGFVDPSCLLIDRVACEQVLSLWCYPLPQDKSGMSTDRPVFEYLRKQKRGAGTRQATAYYSLNPEDCMHAQRLEWIASTTPTPELSAIASPATASPPSQRGRTGGFTQDWFSRHIPLWERILAPYVAKPVRALEIGVFEGRSTVWLLDRVLTHPDAGLTWVDTFGGSPENRGLDLSELENRFRANTARFGAKLTGHVGRSQDVLRGLVGEQFDLVYIDGSHEAADVLSDAVLAWPLLKVDGVLGFDDYAWRMFPEPERCPGLAVDAFLGVMRGRFEDIHRGYQVWIRKSH